MNSRIAGLALAGLLALAWPSLSVQGAPAAAKETAPSPTGFRFIAWDELVPKDWDPLKRFRGMNLDAMGDSNPRMAQLMSELRQTWDNAPTNRGMDGAKVRVAGYVVPLEEVKGELKEFLLVPYFGACIHSPPPPANQIIHVLAATPFKGFRAMDPVFVSGTLQTSRDDSPMGVSGYRMQAVVMDHYLPGAKP